MSGTPTGKLTIVPAVTAEERKEFVRFPWQVYRGDPYWVPPLLSERDEFVDPERVQGKVCDRPDRNRPFFL